MKRILVVDDEESIRVTLNALLSHRGYHVVVASGAKAALKKLVWEKPLRHAAADIGVSDVAQKKRCVKLGIRLPPRGHWARQRRGRAK